MILTKTYGFRIFKFQIYLALRLVNWEHCKLKLAQIKSETLLKCLTYCAKYNQHFTLESWYASLEQTEFNHCKPQPVPYKINDYLTENFNFPLVLSRLTNYCNFHVQTKLKSPTHHPRQQSQCSSNYQSQYRPKDHYICFNYQPSLDSEDY